MALLERVSTLVRANLNDMIDKAEDPEKMLKQVILDMQNQLLQVKTQVAIAIADQHLLAKKKKEQEEKAAEWKRKAELALDKGQDDLARAALERSLSCQRMAGNFDEQIRDQTAQVENLKSALSKLDAKLDETKSRTELLMSQHRRARAFNRAGDARLKMDDGTSTAAFDRIDQKVQRDEAVGLAKADMIKDSVEDRLAKLEKDDEVDKLLAEMKASRRN